jgi:phosphatidate cytidylyltransferase
MTGLRVLSAIVMLAGLLAIVLLTPPLWTSLLIVASILIAAWEWSGFLRLTKVLPRLLYVLLTALLLGGGLGLALQPARLQAVLVIAALWWLVALLWIALAPHRVSRYTAAMAGWLTLVPAGVALLAMHADATHGLRWLLYTFCLVWAADTGAYFAGRKFGRRKLAPQVSPGKSWEGAIGGLLLVAVLAASAAGSLGQAPLRLVLLSLVVAAFSIVGDLSESLFKRYAGLKDSGRLIPGHGGLMDRIDSITAAAPLLLLGLQLFGSTAP